MEQSSPVKAGDVLAGKYRVDRVLGAGGMGVVVAAHHMQLDIPVALKFLLPGSLGDGTAVARFLKEGRAAARVRSEHIVRVHDVGTLESGSPYLVMEYLEGNDLAEELKKNKRLRAELAVSYVLQACDAIAEAHAIGIVHRDLKPQNLFLTRRNDGSACVKVLDFGIAKLNLSTADQLTRTTAVMGSPLYMSPEVMQSARNADHRTDIWSLGVILYQLVTGELPFNGETLPAVCLKIVNEAPSPPSSLATLPAELERIILRCLAKRPSERFQSVKELSDALSDWAEEGDKPRASRVSRVLEERASADVEEVPPTRAAGVSSGAPAITGPAEGQQTVGGWGATQPPRHKRALRALVLVAALFAVVTLSAIVVRLTARSGAATGASAASAEAIVASAPTASATVSAEPTPIVAASSEADAAPPDAPAEPDVSAANQHAATKIVAAPVAASKPKPAVAASKPKPAAPKASASPPTKTPLPPTTGGVIPLPDDRK